MDSLPLFESKTASHAPSVTASAKANSLASHQPPWPAYSLAWSNCSADFGTLAIGSFRSDKASINEVLSYGYYHFNQYPMSDRRYKWLV